MVFCKKTVIEVVLNVTFDCCDEILTCDHPNESHIQQFFPNVSQLLADSRPTVGGGELFFTLTILPVHVILLILLCCLMSVHIVTLSLDENL